MPTPPSAPTHFIITSVRLPYNNRISDKNNHKPQTLFKESLGTPKENVGNKNKDIRENISFRHYSKQ